MADSSSESPPQLTDTAGSEAKPTQLPKRKFPKLFGEFLEFTSSVREQIADPYECRLINLIVENFDAIAEAGTSQGQRGRLINRLIQEAGRTVPSTILATGGQKKPNEFPFVSLASIEVGQFKGFSSRERIPLDRKYNLVYGPNGSGKSSFCEALEYSLLGYINEANSRRIELSAYIRNRFTGAAEEPVLIATDANGETVSITPDASLFGFCFIEKNRIESFGRISANTPAAKQNLLASLFGLSDFNDFVANFTKNIETYIDTAGNKQKELASKAESLTVHRDNLKDSTERLQELQQTKLEVGKKAFPSLSPQELTTRLNDMESLKKEVSSVTAQLTEQVPNPLSVKASLEITDAFGVLEATRKDFMTLLQGYSEQKEKVVFRDLFAAVVLLEEQGPEKCPVCETPVEQTTKHPYENAKTKLKELTGIVEMENKIAARAKEIRVHLASLKTELESRKEACRKLGLAFDGPDMSLFEGLLELENQQLADRCLRTVVGWEPERLIHAQVDKAISSFNLKIAGENERKNVLRVQLENLMSINTTEGMIQTETQNIKKWQEEIQEFNTKNAVLIKEAGDEKPIVEQNRLYVWAYNSFLTKLNKYKDELPLIYVNQLNDLTLEIYNLINSSDRRYEKANSLTLPSAVGETIQVGFADNPDRKLDVLSIFSEGHLRCLGLSILLAKNIQSGCPVIIFDDVVNAIDDDHRGGIRELIFSYEKLASKQIILSTHGEQFVSELEQRVKLADYENMVRKLSFILDQDKRLIRVRSDSQKNYLHRAKSCVENADWKEALYYCRCCLEHLSSVIWKRLGNRGFKTDFPVVIRTPNGQPDLMSIITSLNSFLKKHDAFENAEEITTIFDYLLGLESSSKVIWQYLNKGTHEEDNLPEFDCVIVQEISQRLLRLDELTK
jgi:energy-coupling factor transporter ATP-binding protein EcfA2